MSKGFINHKALHPTSHAIILIVNSARSRILNCKSTLVATVEQLREHVPKDLKKSGPGSWLLRHKTQLKKYFREL